LLLTLWSVSGGTVEFSLRMLFLSSPRVWQYVSYSLSFKLPHIRKPLSYAVAGLTILWSVVPKFYETSSPYLVDEETFFLKF
jgi:hypothetical protein